MGTDYNDFNEVRMRGDKVKYRIDVTINSDPYTLDPTDTLWFTAKTAKTQTDAEAAFQKSSGDGITHMEGGTWALLEIDPEDTIDLTKDTSFYCDIQLVKSNEPMTLMTGKFKFKLDITQAVV